MSTNLIRKSGGAGVLSVLLSCHHEHTVKERLRCTEMKEEHYQVNWQSSPDSLAAPVVSETATSGISQGFTAQNSSMPGSK